MVVWVCAAPVFSLVIHGGVYLRAVGDGDLSVLMFVQVWTESQQRYEEEVKTWLSDENTENLCAGTTITATSQAIAQAVAAVWANSFVELECSGGFGCGWSLGNAAGYAASVAEAMSLAVADATESNEVSDSHAESFCFADVRAVGGAFVSAFAQAASDTCATFGDSVDYENSYALSVQSAIATALARATVSICRSKGLLVHLYIVYKIWVHDMAPHERVWNGVAI